MLINPQGRKVALRAGLGAGGSAALSPSKSGRGWRNRSPEGQAGRPMKNFDRIRPAVRRLAFLPLLIIWQLTFGFGLLGCPH